MFEAKAGSMHHAPEHLQKKHPVSCLVNVNLCLHRLVYEDEFEV